jgi:hypothetical protein
MTLKSKHDAATVIDAGHPPVAEGTVLVDWDGVIQKFGMIYDTTDPIDGVPEALRKLASLGYRIVIFTSRLSKVWHDSEGWDHEKAKKEQLDYMQTFLDKYDIPYDDFTCEKIPSLAYFDDKAYRVATGPNGLANAVAEFLSERTGV